MTHNDFKKMKRELRITNDDIAQITGLSADSVRSMTRPSKPLPAWVKSMLFVYNYFKNKDGDSDK